MRAPDGKEYARTGVALKRDQRFSRNILCYQCISIALLKENREGVSYRSDGNVRGNYGNSADRKQ